MALYFGVPLCRSTLCVLVRRCSGSPGRELALVVSSLRVDTVAAAGLNISRKHIWELHLTGQLKLNGETVLKKSSKVCVGDVVEVDRVLDDPVIQRGRVVITDIGSRTRKGGYHISVNRYKTLFHKGNDQH